MSSECVFCEIAAGNKEEDIVWEDDSLVVFPDMHPRVSHHYLITPKTHYHDFAEMMTKEPNLLIHIGHVVEKLVDQQGIRGSLYTWGFHAGGKQSVDHIHAQLLAGMGDDELTL